MQHLSGIRMPLDRVAANSSPKVNDRIADAIDARLDYFARHPEEIEQRLNELDREWDIERSLALTAGTLSVASCTLGAFVNRRFYAVAALVGGFLAQHALQGWSPPLPLFRMIGVRTSREIEEERRALESILADRDLT